MSKYDALWRYLQTSGQTQLTLTFDEIAALAGTALDHSFLTRKKELPAYGYAVGKISMKQQTVIANEYGRAAGCGRRSVWRSSSRSAFPIC